MKQITTVLAVLSIGFGAPCVLADELPDAQVNPQTGVIEIADPVWAGDNYDIHYVVAPGERSQSIEVTTHPANDRRPRVAIAPDGDAYIVWWREVETPQVLVRRHDHSAGTWSAESVLSAPDLPGRNPEIVHDGTNVWVAFIEEAPLETRIKVGAIEDQPDPFGALSEIASTTYDGDVDARVHARSGHLWVTWTDSDLDLAWTEYDYASATWSTLDFESYADDDIKLALERVAVTVLGN